MKDTFRKHGRPAAAGDILATTLKYLRLDKKMAQYESFQHWPEVVGNEIADIAFPEKIIANKIMVVRVLDAAWIQELSFKKTAILNKYKEVCKNTYLEDLRFVCGDPKQFRKTNQKTL